MWSRLWSDRFSFYLALLAFASLRHERPSFHPWKINSLKEIVDSFSTACFYIQGRQLTFPIKGEVSHTSTFDKNLVSNEFARTDGRADQRKTDEVSDDWCESINGSQVHESLCTFQNQMLCSLNIMSILKTFQSKHHCTNTEEQVVQSALGMLSTIWKAFIKGVVFLCHSLVSVWRLN